MSEEKIEVDYHKNGNKRCEIPKLNGNIHGLARYWWGNGQLREESNWLNGQRHGLRRWWYYNGFIAYFEFWHKNNKVIEFWFKYKSKATAPKPNKPIFSTNQFLSIANK